MKKVFCIILAALMAFSVFASGSSDSSAAVKAVDQIYYEAFPTGGQGESSFITTTAHRLDSTVNEPGVAITWQGGLKNLLVESYEMEEDGKVWILHIREDAKWHDGYDVVADDFIWSYTAWANPKVSSRWNEKASSIEGYEALHSGASDVLSGVTAIDDKTVRVELSNAMPLWMKLEQTYLVIFPYHIFKDVAPEDVVAHPYWKARIGTGPFKWEEYKPDQYIKLVRNDEYYDGPAKLDAIYYVIYADAAAMLNAYASGEIHSTFYEGNSITPDSREYYQSLPGHTVVTMDKGSCSTITLNFNDPDWADLRVRQAMMYALDIDSILANLYPGAIKARTLFPQKWTWTDNLNQYEYNPELAKELLAEAGFSGKTHNLYYTQTDTLTQNLLVACQQYWAAVGVDVALRKIDAAAVNDIHANSPDMLLLGTGMALDPSLAETLVKSGSLLAYGYSNPRVDELLALGKTLSNQEDRVPVYQEVADILNADVAKLFLWYDIRDLGYSDNVIGPKEHYAEQGTILFNMGVYNEITSWYVE